MAKNEKMDWDVRRTLRCSKVDVVAIVGGTHGNETNGVYLQKYFRGDASKRSTFETKVLLANIAASQKNLRYVEEDMNRCFYFKDLANAEHTATLEARRAKEIDAELGPKRPGVAPKADFIIDLHNTTANTGVALMCAPDDDFAHEVGHYLMSIDPEVRICNWVSGVDDWPMLPSIGRSGITFEVGACPCGCLIGPWYEKSRVLLLKTLDYIEMHNKAIMSAGGEAPSKLREISVPVYQKLPGTVDYPRDADGDLMGMAHPNLQDHDFRELKDGDPLFLMIDGTTQFFSKKKYQVPLDQPIYPFFVNEAAYYEKKVAMMLGKRIDRTLKIVPKL